MVKGSPIRPRPSRPPGCGHSRFGRTAGVLLSMESSSQASRVAERSFPHLVERCPRPAFGEQQGAPPPPGPPQPPGPNDPFPCGLMAMPGMVRMGGMPISQVMQMLTGQTGRLVFDRTNLTGTWDFLLGMRVAF